MKTRKIIAIFPLVILVIFVILSSTGRIRFGYGLGDVFYYGFVYIVFLIYGIYFIIKRKKLDKVNLIFPFIAIIFCIYISLSMTVWRGTEYKWKGDVLAPTRKEIGKQVEERYKKRDQDKLEAKLTSLNEQIKEKPNDYNLRMDKGFFFLKNGKYQLALDEYKIAYEIDPENQIAHMEADYTFGLIIKEYEKKHQADTSKYELKKQIERLKKNYPFGTNTRMPNCS